MPDPAGVRNKNYWDVKPNPNREKTGDWLGQLSVDTNGLCVFIDPAFSARAALRTVSNSVFDRGNDSLLRLFEEYAPVNDTAANNDPVQYATLVAGKVGISINDSIKLFFKFGNGASLTNLMDAMAIEEIGHIPGKPEIQVINYGIFMFNRDFKPRA